MESCVTDLGGMSASSTGILSPSHTKCSTITDLPQHRPVVKLQPSTARNVADYSNWQWMGRPLCWELVRSVVLAHVTALPPFSSAPHFPSHSRRVFWIMSGKRTRMSQFWHSILSFLPPTADAINSKAWHPQRESEQIGFLGTAVPPLLRTCSEFGET